MKGGNTKEQKKRLNPKDPCPKCGGRLVEIHEGEGIFFCVNCEWDNAPKLRRTHEY